MAMLNNQRVYMYMYIYIYTYGHKMPQVGAIYIYIDIYIYTLVSDSHTRAGLHTRNSRPWRASLQSGESVVTRQWLPVIFVG